MSRAVTSETLHLRPHAEVAERVLLPGDPGRAMRIAQLLLDGPRMLNHHRGLWGYTGVAADGELLTVQSTGMGGPSAAIVCEELLRLGARRFVRVGTCGALVDGPRLGELVLADAALPEDGASRALGAAGPVAPDAALHAELCAAAPDAHAGLVVSADLFYDPDPGRAARWTAAGAIAVEMEAATVLRFAERAGAAAACVLAVSDVLTGGTRERIGPEALEHAEAALGRAGAGALGVPAA
jgi:DeoD family purine-nucleoside phosphorylase